MEKEKLSLELINNSNEKKVQNNKQELKVVQQLTLTDLEVNELESDDNNRFFI
jgi:hypothetical protein